MSEEQKVRKVLVATPALDGRLDVWYTNSLVNSIRLAQANNIFLHPVFMAYDALIQRARNDLFKVAVDGEYDDMIWIDSDMEWNPEWIMQMLEAEEDVLGGTARKKTDEAEIYVAKIKDFTKNNKGYIKCEGLGTGFVKLSRKAFMALWESSQKYTNGDRTCRMVCDVKIVDGELYSEDTIIFKKLNELGFDCWLDPKMTCNHVGTKKFVGNMVNFLDKMQVA